LLKAAAFDFATHQSREPLEGETPRYLAS